MSAWAVHLVLGSVGLALATLLASALLWVWRRQPVPAYRLLVYVLAAALLMPVGQHLVRGVEWPVAGALGARLGSAAESWLGAESGAERVHGPSERQARLEGSDAVSRQLDAYESELGAMARDQVRLERELSALSNGDADIFAPERASLGSKAPAGAPDAAHTIGAAGEQPPGVGRPKGATWFGALERPQARALLLSALALLYAVGFLASAWQTVRKLIQTRRLLRTFEPVNDPLVHEVWADLARQSTLGPRVRLGTSAVIGSPMCFDLGRPVILLPAPDELALTPEVLRCVLLHELVHLERRDTWTLMAQELLRVVFWFHPAAWWLCRKLDGLRELSCDLLVVRRTRSAKRYASALVEYADWMRRSKRAICPSTALLPWASPTSPLARRIEMLIQRPNQRPWSTRGTVFAATALFAVLWSGQLALAAAMQQQPPQPGAAPRVEPSQAAPSQASQPGAPTWPERPAVAPAPLARATRPLVRAVPPGTQGGVVAPLSVAPRGLASPGAAPLPGARVPRSPSLGRVGVGSPGAPAVPAPLGIRQEARDAYQQGAQSTPMIGVQIEPLAADAAQERFGWSESAPAIVVGGVLQGSPAERVRLQEGDVIISVNGEPATLESLKRGKLAMGEGGVNLTVLRDGQHQNFVIRTEANQARGGSGSSSRRGARVEARGQGAEGGRGRSLGRRASRSRSQGELDRAREALEEAMRLDPANSRLREALNLLEERSSGASGGISGEARSRYEDAIRERTERQQARRRERDVLRERNSADAADARRRYELREQSRARSPRPTRPDGKSAPDARLEELQKMIRDRQRELDALQRKIDELRAQRAPSGTARIYEVPGNLQDVYADPQAMAVVPQTGVQYVVPGGGQDVYAVDPATGVPEPVQVTEWPAVISEYGAVTSRTRPLPYRILQSDPYVGTTVYAPAEDPVVEEVEPDDEPVVESGWLNEVRSLVDELREPVPETEVEEVPEAQDAADSRDRIR